MKKIKLILKESEFVYRLTSACECLYGTVYHSFQISYHTSHINSVSHNMTQLQFLDGEDKLQICR